MKKGSYGKVFDKWLTCTRILIEAGISVEMLQEGISDLKESMK